ncbi:MAG: ATP-binding cassette domain-containing protein [Chloroflexota bacterium]|nr:ATP-binding cassette domain-containing protein [Chloroflexota bacterium]
MDIELRHVYKRFGRVHANNDINVVFKGGRIVGILGENGAGKSTLMKILSGYQPADSGDVLIDGTSAVYRGPQAAIAAGVGMLQQDPLDVAAFTVLENFTYGQARGLSNRDARARLEQISRDFGFDLDPDLPVAQLSIGQRQQLEIARLLAQGVRTLILDEPTTGISAQQKALLFDALRALAHDQGMLVLLVSHKLEDVQALCDEVIVLRAGKLVGGLTMPATTAQLIELMFGQVLSIPPRPDVPMGTAVLQLDNLHLRDKRIRVEALSLQVRAGEVIGLAGLDGSGQELLMRASAGLQRVTHGHIRLRDTDITHAPYRDRLHAGLVFSAAGRLEEGLVAGLTLMDHMALVMNQAAMIDWGKARERSQAQIEHYNVRGRAEDRIEALSGGNQQRWLMALLPAQPAVMVLEQPTRGLDVDSAQWVWQQLLERRAHGTAILFSSPDLDELIAYSDRIIVFFAGRYYEVRDARRATVEQLGRLIGGQFEERAS